MAKKLDQEFIKDSRAENQKFRRGVQNGTSPLNDTKAPEQGAPEENQGTPPGAEESGKQSEANAGQQSHEAGNSEQSQSFHNPPPPPPEKNEFKEKFEDYFKGIGKSITGEVVVNMVDDLKSNLLMIYAKKQGLDIEKEKFKMDKKSHDFAVFLVDHGLKNKLLDFLEKRPLLAAGGVIALSAGSSFAMIELLKTMKSGEKKQEEENARLRKQIAEMKRKQAEEAQQAEEA